MAERQQTLGEKLQSLPKPLLYLILILCTSVPLFINMRTPNTPNPESIDMYAWVSRVEPGSTVLIASDWTSSTRGESGGQFEALVRVLMRRGIRFAVYSSADPQAPQVFTDAVQRVNISRTDQGQPAYEHWNDWINLGYLPNAEAAGQAIANNVRTAFQARRVIPPGTRELRGVFDSPVMANIRDLSDFPLIIIVTASKTSTISIERFYGKVPISLMVTGVMGPESLNYYATGQIVGMLNGLKGLYDFEQMMEVGVNWEEAPNGQTVRASQTSESFAGFPGMPDNKGNGHRYYPTLHFALTLLILCVIIGNIGMFLSKKGAKKR
jgi:hypothetical protein